MAEACILHRHDNLMVVKRHRLAFKYELRHEKTCFRPMRTTKAQISVRIRTV